ncbi:MAG: DUF1700 domain-containing protein [Clostridiales bacterium]|nr:DUF1700 domain-containing protein [Clostridiales bacterium]
MNKEEFITELRQRLAGLPQEDLDERISFYEEMISDRTEDGMSEEEAVAQIGSVDSVVEQIMSEIPLAKLVKEKVKPKRRMKTWEIVLLACGSPVWVPLLIAFSAVAFALYIVLWALVICVYAIDICFAVCSIGGIVSSVMFFMDGNPAAALYFIGASLILAGLAILMFYASVAVTKGVIKLTGKILLKIKSMFVGRRQEK